MDFIPVTKTEKQRMLDELGIRAVEDLFDITIPEPLRLRRPLDIPEGISEYELIRDVSGLAECNASLDRYACFLGAGAYDHFVPSIVDAVASLPELYTAYTPYQPEVSQGVLQSLFEYQSMICELTGFEVANGSLYDGSTSVAEAALFAHDVTGKKREVIISETVHPEYRDVLKGYTRGLGMTITTIPAEGGVTKLSMLEGMIGDDTACVILQHPNFFGYLEDMPAAGAIVGATDALCIACVDPISLGILKPPAEYGADVAVGEGQALGNRVNFGGPYLGMSACKREYIRRVPGHLISEATDTRGQKGYVLTLQTREQHIKRERATSNICTSEALNAIIAAAYMSYVGPDGIRDIAAHCLQKAHYANARLGELDYLEPFSDAGFFKEFAFKSARPVKEINRRLFDEGIIGGLDLGRLYPQYEDTILFCVTEKRTKAEIDRLVDVMGSM